MSSKPIKFSEIDDAFFFVSSGAPAEHEAFLDRETGEIHLYSAYLDDSESLPDDIDEHPEKYIALPHKNELNLGKALVLSFADEHMPKFSGKIREIFSSPGAYARFKDLLEYEDMLQKWYDYEQAAGEKTLREWCAENDIEVTG